MSRLWRVNLTILCSGLIYFPTTMADCWQQAANRYGIEVPILKAIAKVESNYNQAARERPSNGTESVGIMQINSENFSVLQEYGITRQMLIDNTCLNIHVGAWVLAHARQRYGNTWLAVGAYNAGYYTTQNKDKRFRQYRQYSQKIYEALYQGR